MRRDDPPNVAVAEDLVRSTIDLMTFGPVPGQLGVAGTSAIECFIGASLTGS